MPPVLVSSMRVADLIKKKGSSVVTLPSSASVAELLETLDDNQIGAVVESQPFGGEGLSGTGPKAGGPHYVARFATERVVCIDTTAAGGNATLMASIEG